MRHFKTEANILMARRRKHLGLPPIDFKRVSGDTVIERKNGKLTITIKGKSE